MKQMSLVFKKEALMVKLKHIVVVNKPTFVRIYAKLNFV